MDMVTHKSELLLAKEDEHNGVIVEMHQAMESHLFASLLKSSICHWKEQGKKSVWIKLRIELASLVEPAVREGFYYHHAEPSYLMLARWLSDTPNMLPPNASHRVGVGAFILNHNKEVLVVQEKNGFLKGKGVWKFPTGTAEKGEDIIVAVVREVKEETGGEDITVAVVREVKEETGIDARFQELLAFRQSHNELFEKSDLSFLCMLEPLSFDIQIQESEIETAKWIPFLEYAAQPFVKEDENLRRAADICRAKMEGEYYSGFSAATVKSGLGKQGNESLLFFNSQHPFEGY